MTASRWPARHRLSFLVAALTAVLSACASDTPAPPPATPEPVPVSAAPRPRPALPPSQADLRRARAEAARAAPVASERSQVMSGYLSRIEDRLVGRGLLRMDRAEGAAMSVNGLTADFNRIALRDEYTSLGAASAGANATPAPLRRWAGEVRLQPVFGASVPPQVQARDRQAIAAVAARLARATGHPVRAVAEGGNFLIAVTSQDDAPALLPRIAAAAPGIPASDLAALPQVSPQTFCTVFAYGRAGGPDYVAAVALIRAELPPRLRAACFEEELAQGLGLPNDSGDADPSIFNDNEAYALLTRHDELLLRMLYDARLRPGMTEAEAAPVAEAIAAELLGQAPVSPPPAAPVAPIIAPPAGAVPMPQPPVDPAGLPLVSAAPAVPAAPAGQAILVPVDVVPPAPTP